VALDEVLMTTLLSPGLHHGVPFADYLADPGVNNGALSDLDRSPAHCFALHLDPERPPQDEPTPAMRAGTLAHCLVLEPEEFVLRYVIKPYEIDYRKKAGQAWKAAEDRTIVTAEDVSSAMKQRDAILRNDYMAGILEGADTEVSVIWNETGTGHDLRCKARPDAMKKVDGRTVVADVKTTADITPRSIQRTIATFGYHRQQAHYCAGLEACGVAKVEFVFFFVSSTYPYLAVPYVLDDETAQQGRDEVAELLTYYAECKHLGKWPVCGAGPQLIGLPQYAKRSSEVEISYV
jgi:hypothetical protein